MTSVAIVGTGFWGANLAEAVGRSSLELAACYSRSADKRDAFAERFGCEAADSYEAADELDELTTLTVGGEVVDFEHVDPLVDELEELGRCARGAAEPETGAEEGIAALRVIIEATQRR